LLSPLSLLLSSFLQIPLLPSSLLQILILVGAFKHTTHPSGIVAFKLDANHVVANLGVTIVANIDVAFKITIIDLLFNNLEV
jgi:hypothetical protein